MFTIDNLLARPDSVRKEAPEEIPSPEPGPAVDSGSIEADNLAQWAHIPLLSAPNPNDPAATYPSPFPLLPFGSAGSGPLPGNAALNYPGPSGEDPMNLASWLYSSDMSILRNSLLSFGGEQLI